MSLPERVKPRVLCVMSPDWVGTTRLPGVLSRAGCRTTLLTDPRNMTARSRYVDELIPGDRDPAANVERLRRHLESGAAYDWIILADDPTMVEGVRRCRESWCRGWFPIDPSSIDPEILTQKTRFVAAAQMAELPIPPSITASTADDVRAAARSIGFPVLIKPAQGSAGKGIISADTAEELESRLPPAGSFVVQRRIAGRTGGTLVLFDRGRPLWWHNSLRVQFWPKPYGPSCQRRSVHHPAFGGLMAKAGAMLGMTGLCEIEWILPDDGGVPRLIELNPRPPSFHYMAEQMGADLPGAIRAFLAGDKTVTAPAAGPEGPVVRLFPEDATRALESFDWLDCARWLTGSAGPLPWDDPAIFRAYVWRSMKYLVHSLIRPFKTRKRPT